MLNEILTGSAMAETRVFSMLSIYSMKDYWEEVNENMATPTWFGRGKGCDFLEGNCQDKGNFEEFPGPNTSGITFNYEGWGGSFTDTFSDQCLMMRV